MHANCTIKRIASILKANMPMARIAKGFVG